MAKGKYQAWLEPDKLEQITNWAANGLTYEQIAQNMGIHRATLARWVNDHRDICDAIKKGRMLADHVIENALFMRACGRCTIEETVEEFRGELRDGKPYNGTVVKRTVTKQLPPDVTACIFFLKNRAPERWSDRREVEVTQVPTIVFGIEPKRAED